MIGTSLPEWIFIRLSIVFFQYSPLIYFVLIAANYVFSGYEASNFVSTRLLTLLLVAEVLFAVLVYLPRVRRLNDPANHPPPMTAEGRRTLFQRCLTNLPYPEAYLRGWFLGAELTDIWRENLREFLLWGFFEVRMEEMDPNSERYQEIIQETDEYIDAMEARMGQKLHPGTGPAKSFRLTFDNVDATYRGLAWYSIVFLVDQITHLALRWYGFVYHARGTTEASGVFPPRPQELFSTHRSPVPEQSYWYKPHRSETQQPVIFFHGIGVGLLTYIRFLADLHAATVTSGDDGIGIIAFEILPVSFRLIQPPCSREVFLQQLTTIVDYHEWEKFTIAAHSYGSVATSYILRDDTLSSKVTSVMLVDPVTIMLHMPDVAFNFTRRSPQKANEWQLWYFASTDPTVAHCLARHFFWRDCILWKEDLEGLTTDTLHRYSVSLAGKDIIVDGYAVARYIQDDSGELGDRDAEPSNVLWYDDLDHAQVFDNSANYKRIIHRILEDQRQCSN